MQRSRSTDPSRDVHQCENNVKCIPAIKGSPDGFYFPWIVIIDKFVLMIISSSSNVIGECAIIVSHRRTCKYASYSDGKAFSFPNANGSCKKNGRGSLIELRNKQIDKKRNRTKNFKNISHFRDFLKFFSIETSFIL